MSITFSYLLDEAYPVFALGEFTAVVARKLIDLGLGGAPVLDGERYVGLVFLASLFRGRQGGPPASETLDTSMIETVKSFLPGDLLFDNLLLVSLSRSGLVPIANQEGIYAGVVLKQRVLGFLADRIHAGEGGSTLEIEVPPTGARLSEIIETLEKNDASILSYTSWLSGGSVKSRILFFRLACHDFFRLVRNMENYGYLIRFHSSFTDAENDEMREKALEFIRYIDM